MSWRMTLKELRNLLRGPVGPFMASLVNNGLHRCAVDGRVYRTIPAARLTLRNTVNAACSIHRLLLEREWDIPVVFAPCLEERFWHGG